MDGDDGWGKLVHENGLFDPEWQVVAGSSRIVTRVVIRADFCYAYHRSRSGLRKPGACAGWRHGPAGLAGDGLCRHLAAAKEGAAPRAAGLLRTRHAGNGEAGGFIAG